MNQKITRTEFRESMDRRLSAMKAEPWLAQRIIAAEGGEKTVAKKLSVSMILVIALIAVLATGALAATLGAWGIIDFAGNHYGAYIPPKYEDCIKSENVTAETETLSVNIRESYYDGTLLRVTADVTPKQPVFLLGEGVYPEDPAFDSLPGLESEEITVAQAARERFDGRMAEIVLYTDESTSASGDCRMNDDNSATLYIEEVFDDEQKDRDVTLHLSYIPIRDLPAEAESGEISGEGEEEFDPFDFDRQETVDIPMTFHSAETRTFVCDRPMDFPSVGVQVTKVTIKATPLEILYNIDYAVTDVAKFEAQEGGLWFEFIDPQSTAADPYDQCLVSGLTSIGTARRVDDESEDEAGQPVEVGTAYYQRDSIGLNALSDEYTLRVREFMEENRYESITFRVEEAR